LGLHYFYVAMKCRIKHILFFFSFCYSQIVFSQVTDNFSDGNFTSNPAWSGNDTDFIVNTNHQLQLNSSGSGTSYLSLSNSQPLADCEWNFLIDLNFSPSSGNFARAYLVSDKKDLSGNLNGYYLQFGESGSNDKVRLFRQTGSASDSICSGTTNISNAFSIRVKVTRDNSGSWKLFIDPTGGTNYFQEAAGTDNTFTSTNFFGVFCNYTSTNATKFYFDDFYIYSPPDVIPATLDSVKAVSGDQIDAYFSEALDAVSAQSVANYSVNNGIGFASAAAQDTIFPAVVHLSFAADFLNEQTYALSVTGVQDLAGNNTLNNTVSFLFFVPGANDVVINEIMADPDPPVGLPDYEYVELFNRTHYPLRLNNWRFTAGSYTKTFPDVTLSPDGFLILCKDSAVSLFRQFGPVTGIFTSSTTLANTGTTLVLRDAQGKKIHSVNYSDNWYNDPIKSDGGWSLEQINPNSPCGGSLNWKVSADNSGGTPGRKNSVYSAAPDITPPKISHTALIANDTVQIFFDKPMDSLSLANSSFYSVDRGIGNPAALKIVGLDFSSVQLKLSSPILAGILYTVSINGIKDCAGNNIAAGSSGQFGIPEKVASGDIAINEVMFDPEANGVEWVEIYNRSNKLLDLKEIYFCSQNDNGMLKEINQIAPEGFLMLPEKYFVLSTNSDAIRSHYNTTNPEGFIEMPSIPSLSNDSDWIVLTTATQTTIDKLHYNSSWHLPLLTSTKGISLERINYGFPAQDAGNWHSAAESVGGATPAYKNSQYADGESGNEISISPEIFSPDNDGYNDVLSISYAFDTPGMIGSINIYDSRGRLTRRLVRNELLATTGTFFWDGITDDKQKAGIGIYIIYIEAFDVKGAIKKFKKTCVVGGRL